ncbi:MAG: Fur family transcriptional regulator [Anaerolineae bacterium]
MVCAETIVRQLRAQGERLTVQRQWVIEALCDRGEHLTVQQVQSRLTQQGASLTETTVYRILQWLKERGVVAQTDLGQSGVVYQIIDRQPHHHLVCLRCGQIVDLDDSIMDGLRAELRRRYDFEPRIDHMAVFGLCRACRDQDARTPDSAPE